MYKRNFLFFTAIMIISALQIVLLSGNLYSSSLEDSNKKELNMIESLGKENQEDQAKEEILSVLKIFQKGYTGRDVSIVESYVEELFAPEILIVGTGASEWCEDPGSVKRIVESDWKYWGDLLLDIDKAIIRTEKDNAWIAVPGTLTRKTSKEDGYERSFNVIKRALESEGENRKKLFEIEEYLTRNILALEHGGDVYSYPIRVTASLVKRSNKWQFIQMTFSYPYPRERIIEK